MYGIVPAVQHLATLHIVTIRISSKPCRYVKQFAMCASDKNKLSLADRNFDSCRHYKMFEPRVGKGLLLLNFVKTSLNPFLLFIPCIVDDQLTTLSPTKRTTFSPDILYYNSRLNPATCFGPPWDHEHGITLK
jgi:hypothetical protein